MQSKDHEASGVGALPDGSGRARSMSTKPSAHVMAFHARRSAGSHLAVDSAPSLGCTEHTGCPDALGCNLGAHSIRSSYVLVMSRVLGAIDEVRSQGPDDLGSWVQDLLARRKPTVVGRLPTAPRRRARPYHLVESLMT